MAERSMQPERCPICLEFGTNYYFSLKNNYGSYPIKRCSNCKGQFALINNSSEIINAQESFFDHDSTDLYNTSDTRKYWKREVRLIMSLGYKSGNILDIGCNAGHFLDSCGPDFIKYGIELADGPAKIAAAKGIDVKTEPIENCSFNGLQFDVITMYALIEHLQEPNKVIESVTQLLRPGGLFVVMTGDVKSRKAKVLGQNWHMYIPPLHTHFFSRKSLKMLGAMYGMHEIHHRYSHGGMVFFKNSKILNYTEKALLWPILDLPLLRKFPLYDHYYGYFKKLD